MPKLPQLQAKDLEKVARKVGFFHDRTTGSHFIYFREEDQKAISIPKHKGKTLGKGLAHSLIKQMDLTKEEFLKLLKKK